MKKPQSFDTLVFVLDHLFCELRWSEDEKQLLGLDFMPGSERALAEFAKAGAKITLVLPRPVPKEALERLRLFAPEIGRCVTFSKNVASVLEGGPKAAAGETLFIAADRVVRGEAARRGWKTAPGPAVAALMRQDGAPVFVRALGPREMLRKLGDLVPYAWDRQPDGAWCLLAAVSRATLAELIRRGARVQALPLDLALEDPVFAQLDDPQAEAIAELARQKVLFAGDGSVLLALPPGQFADALPLHGEHGHFRQLMPNPGLLEAAPATDFSEQAAHVALTRWPEGKVELIRWPAEIDLAALLGLRCPASAAEFQADVDRYRGAAPLDAAGNIASRHERHPDNARAVAALLAELRAIGYCAYTHAFNHAGRTLQNVIADLPGRGLFRIRPDLREILREAILKHPWPDPPDPWIEALAPHLGSKWLPRAFRRLPPRSFAREMERLFDLPRWFPWWLCLSPLPGPFAQVVILGCHMDSTAASDSGFDPLADAAPGADDDASGIAATLAVARQLWNRGRHLRHTVRFCFFNAEESGLVGSRAYAAAMKAARAPIKAVVCADMIGFNSDAVRTFEIHAGARDPAVRDLSVPIADRVAASAAALGSLGAAQIYRGTTTGPGSDRNVVDGAIGRSDHASFHEQGYPAVVVSEDLFINLPGEPAADANPNYHRGTDTVIDSAYGADITCAVGRAIEELAS